jgi:hypothetical protein
MRSGWLLTCVLISGCAASAPSERPPSSAVAPVSAAEAGDSTPKSRVWGLLDPRAPLFGYIDGQRFVASPTFRAVVEAVRQVQALRPGAPDLLTDLNRMCGFDPLKAVREVTFAAAPSTEEVTVVIALDRNAERAFACVASVGEPQPGSVAGHTALCKQDDCLVAHQDLLVFGKRARLEELLPALPAPSVVPFDDYLFVSGEFPNPLGVKRAAFTVAPATQGTRLRFEAQSSSAEGAANLEAQAKQLLALAPERLASEPPELQRFAQALLQNLTFSHEGKTTTATLTVEDATLAGSLAALSVYGVKRYVAAAKSAVARATVILIATRLEAYAAGARDHRFPRSAPRVPEKIPAGVKSTTTRADYEHKSWSAIDFQPEEDSYYSYEYETSKDGKRATVRARGDLDGDGVESLFELDVVVEGDKAHSVPPIRETNPTE